MVKKIITLLMLQCFLFTQLGWAVPVSQLRALRGADTALTARLKDVFGQHEIINDRLGKLIQEDKNLSWFVAQDLISENEAKELKAILSGEKTDYDVEEFYGLLRKLGRPLSKFMGQEIFEYFREVLADKNEAFTERFSIEQIDSKIWQEIFSFIRPKTEEDWFEAEDLANLVIANMPPEVEKLGITNKGEDCFEHIGLRPHIVWLALGNRDRLDVLEDMLHGIFEYLIIAREVRKVADEAEYKDLGLVTDGKINWEAVVKLRNENSYRSGYFFAKAHKQAYEMLARYLKRIAKNNFLAENHEIGLLAVYCDRQARDAKAPEQTGKEKAVFREPTDTLLASQAGGDYTAVAPQADGPKLWSDEGIRAKAKEIVAEAKRVYSLGSLSPASTEKLELYAETLLRDPRPENFSNPAIIRYIIDKDRINSDSAAGLVGEIRKEAWEVVQAAEMAQKREEFAGMGAAGVMEVVLEKINGWEFTLVNPAAIAKDWGDALENLTKYDLVGGLDRAKRILEEDKYNSDFGLRLVQVRNGLEQIAKTKAAEAVAVEPRPGAVFVFRKGMAEAIRPIVEASLPKEDRENCMVVEIEQVTPTAIAKAVLAKIGQISSVNSVYYVCDHDMTDNQKEEVKNEIGIRDFKHVYFQEKDTVDEEGLGKVLTLLGIGVKNIQAALLSAQAMQSI